jgi:minor curlin subunit
MFRSILLVSAAVLSLASSAYAGNSSSIVQNGNGNGAETFQRGPNNDSQIVQFGNGNGAGIHQVGRNNNAGIGQNGDFNWASVSQRRH